MRLSSNSRFSRKCICCICAFWLLHLDTDCQCFFLMKYQVMGASNQLRNPQSNAMTRPCSFYVSVWLRWCTREWLIISRLAKINVKCNNLNKYYFKQLKNPNCHLRLFYQIWHCKCFKQMQLQTFFTGVKKVVWVMRFFLFESSDMKLAGLRNTKHICHSISYTN